MRLRIKRIKDFLACMARCGKKPANRRQKGAHRTEDGLTEGVFMRENNKIGAVFPEYVRVARSLKE